MFDDENKKKLLRTFFIKVWTNGERNPTYVCKNDKNVESTWIQGYGALTKVELAINNY